MSITDVLKNNFQYTPTVSNEGLVSMVRKVMGKSNKGESGTLDDQKKDIMALTDLLGKHYNNAQWLKKQTFTTGTVSGKGIVDVLNTKPENIPVVLKQVETEIMGVLDQWSKALTYNYMNHLWLVEIVKDPKNMTDEKLIEVKKKLSDTPHVNYAHGKYPDVLKATGRKLVKEGVYYKPEPVKATDTTILALGENNVQRVAKLLGGMVDRLMDKDAECYFAAEKLWEALKGDRIMKNDDLKPWATMIGRLKPSRVIYNNAKVEAFRELYIEAVLAGCAWIDRSIK